MDFALDYNREEAIAKALAVASSYPKRQALLVLIGLSIVFIISAVWLPPDNSRWVLCPFRFLTGLPCPGCGMTRAFCHIAHGHFVTALRFNPFSVFVFLAVIIFWLKAAAVAFDLEALRVALARLRPSARLSRFALLIVLMWWAARLVGDF
ncbi:MAG: DUF2752 domain-containing protein [Pyrinomonadaceae bacterium]|nr:DUF2752 domain-containing protein [Pyrinomonadaceae bacterium]